MYSARYNDQPERTHSPRHPCLVRQWAVRVLSYSSQYDYAGWSVSQILGEPKVFTRHGDFQGAWAPSVWNAPQFVEVEFEMAVRLSSIHIYETLNPGAVVRIRGRDSVGPWALLWQTDNPRKFHDSRIFSPPLTDGVKMLKVNQLRLDLDLSASHDWCEIDAVQLVGIRDGTVPPIDASEFHADMKKLVNNKLHSDVTLYLRDTPIYGHKAIMAARSPYFAKLLDQKTTKMTLNLPHLTFDDLEAVMCFMYTNRLPTDISWDRLSGLCKASSTFEVTGMKASLIHKLVEGLRCGNVVELFLQSRDDPLLEDVTSVCRSFMASNLKDMALDDSFQALPQDVMVAVVQEATISLCVGDSRA